MKQEHSVKCVSKSGISQKHWRVLEKFYFRKNARKLQKVPGKLDTSWFRLNMKSA
ncbi:hypothetical protein QG37_00872 [Candidozyma auris]|uniref:Uncharacterized protein n=1 Tax=Candidozyma auris TaxID=498019 RepID=A0A0L0P792_CANAR|nr:hypothetical protein QG37_00872 [[Candida] auris]